MSFNLKTISTLFLAGFVLVLSSGLTVYTRFCDDGCESVISISEEDSKCNIAQEIEVEACCMKERAVEKSCCAPGNEKRNHDNEEENHCCETSSFSLDSDFFGSFQKVEITPVGLVSVEIPSFAIHFTNRLQNITDFADLPPPNLIQSGRSIIIQKASFLI
jgi:hypothetical protein